MKAVVCKKLGDPTSEEVLQVETNVPVPLLKPQHIKVRVQAASINFPDALQIKGEYQVKLPCPFVPGSEVSGTVVEVGPGVKRFKPGDKIMAVNSGGAFAEECVVSQYAAWRVPDELDLATAAAVPIVYGTADLALRHRGQLKQGQTVLVLGAGGGVGLAAVQVALAVGATVVAVDLGPEKAAFLRQMGAHHVVDAAASQEPLHKRIKQLVPKGVNVVFDPVGGAVLKEAMKTVAWGAQYIVIGFASGKIPSVPANILLVKNTTLHGTFWGSYLQHNYALLDESMRQVVAWLQSGKIKVHISHRFALDNIRQAFSTLLERRVHGKLLLLPSTTRSRL